MPATHAEATAGATSSDNAAQPPASSTLPSSAAQPGATQANPHLASNASADTTTASAPSDIDRSASDAATAPPQGGHHTPNIASQPTTVDAMSQLGASVMAPQTAATTAISAAQLTATPVTNLAVPVSGLAVQIAASARAGNSRFEIRLDPAELGRIDVRLDVDRHGHVSSHLTVEKPETLAMLRQDAPQLQRALEDAGLKTGQNGLQFSLRDQSSGQQNNNNGQAERQPQRLMISETTAAPVVAASTTYSYAAGASRGLDIRV
ncbi:MAG: flagellar hook-length control protein FliK [Rhizobiales bacterium]|nr:flagellar hook-length control protein FliK [Hyphomicrobiales bacterium]